MLPIKQAIKRRFAMPPQITCASALPGKTGKHENRIFSLNCCISALPELNSSLLDFFSLFHSGLILMLLYDSLNQCSVLLGTRYRGKEAESAAAVGLCCIHNAYAPMRCLPERKKMSSVVCLIASDIC